MKEYRVTWRIDLEAEDPKDAAVRAWVTQIRPHSIARVFEVEEIGSDGEPITIDLDEAER